MRKRLHFHGALKRICPEPVEIFAQTIWEAIEGVTTQLKGFAPDPRTGRKRMQVAGFNTIEALRTPTDEVDIHIFPAMTFGKNAGVIQVIVGVTLIVAAFLLAGPGGGLAAIKASLLASTLFVVGVGMVIGGVMQMLSPVPKLEIGGESDSIRSKYLAGMANTVAIGTPVPILYGKRRCGGHLLSLNIDAKDTLI